MMEVSPLEIDGVKFSQVQAFQDNRGRFLKTLPNTLLQTPLESIALSLNPRVGTIRGIHFQIEPFSEEKVITCVQGSTYEVIVDLRPKSHTLGKKAFFELSQTNGLQVYLPKGIAHGFQTLSPDTVTQYCMTSQFNPEFSFSISPIGELNIEWPIKDYMISDKDRGGISVDFAIEQYWKSTGNF